MKLGKTLEIKIAMCSVGHLTAYDVLAIYADAGACDGVGACPLWPLSKYGLLRLCCLPVPGSLAPWTRALHPTTPALVSSGLGQVTFVTIYVSLVRIFTESKLDIM